MATENKANSLDDDESGSSSRSIPHPEEPPNEIEEKVNKLEDEQEEGYHTIGVKRSWATVEANEWRYIDTIAVSGLDSDNAEAQFEMLYATVYCATMPKLGGLAPTFAVEIMRYIIPECGCYIECWEQRWSEWDTMPDLSARRLIECMTLNRLHASPHFKDHLNAASEAFTHLHDDPDDPYGDLGTAGSWQPIGGMIRDSPIQSDEDVGV